MKKHSGFTLIELMVTLAVAAILLTMAVPSFTDLLKNNRLVTVTNDLVAAANLARSEAIKFGRNATVCVSSNSMTAAPTCTGGADWTQGWLVWVDADGSGGITAGEERRVGDSLAGSTTTLTGTVAQFSYDSTGAADTQATFTICDDRAGAFGRQVVVNTTGRTETSRGINCP